MVRGVGAYLSKDWMPWASALHWLVTTRAMREVQVCLCAKANWARGVLLKPEPVGCVGGGMSCSLRSV